MVNVSLSAVSLNYPGTDRPAVSDVELTINDGEFLVLVGPSGCGKSTTLRMIAGLEFPTSGSILFNDDDVTDLSPKDRDVAMVFQSYALYPHMTVANNMAFALKNAGVPKDKREAQVLDAAKLLELDGLLDRKPRELSGGQRQRVAMGRAIVRQPKVFLMDEPLSNLDAKLRVQTRAQITALQRRLDVTTIYVTHDQTEAMTMGDRVVVMNAGRIEQIGTPRELYDRPKSLFVAAFIGSPTMNLLTVKRGPDNTATGNGITVNLPDIPDGIEDLVVGIRPEDLSTQPGPGTTSFDITLTLVEELGSDSFAYGTTSGQDPLSISEKPIVARLPKGEIPSRGQTLTLHVDPERLRVFDAKTEQLIG